MGKRALILGPTGMGKSHAIQFLDPRTTFIINPDKKELPWRGFERDYKTILKSDGGISFKNSNYAVIRGMEEIQNAIQIINSARPDITTIVIDTISHAMNKSVMDLLSVPGFDKFKTFAKEFYSLMEWLDYTRPDLMVFVTAHVEIVDAVNDKKMVQFQIPSGRFTREALVPESLFTVVLMADVTIVDNKPAYFFKTETNGFNTIKSPEGMFPATIPNNLQFVRDRMNAYYSGEDLPVIEELVLAEQF